MNVSYTVNGERHAFDMPVTELTTPRSIYVACLHHYAAVSGANVRMPVYDDDLDYYRPSDVAVSIDITPELTRLPSLAGYSDEEILEMYTGD